MWPSTLSLPPPKLWILTVGRLSLLSVSFSLSSFDFSSFLCPLGLLIRILLTQLIQVSWYPAMSWVGHLSTHTSVITVVPGDGPSSFLLRGCSPLSFCRAWVVAVSLASDTWTSANYSFWCSSVTSSWTSESDGCKDCDFSSWRLTVVVSRHATFLWLEETGYLSLDSTGSPHPFNSFAFWNRAFIISVQNLLHSLPLLIVNQMLTQQRIDGLMLSNQSLLFLHSFGWPPTDSQAWLIKQS